MENCKGTNSTVNKNLKGELTTQEKKEYMNTGRSMKGMTESPLLPFKLMKFVQTDTSNAVLMIFTDQVYSKQFRYLKQCFSNKYQSSPPPPSPLMQF